MNQFYRDVPGLGNVAVSRHAQARLESDGVTQELFDRVLLHPTQPDIREGATVIWRERDGVRLIIETNPTPNHGAALITTGFRVERSASAVRQSQKR